MARAVKGYTIVSEDGVFIRLEETEDKKGIVLSLTRPPEMKTETAALNKEQFDALMNLRTCFDVRKRKHKKNETKD